MRRIIARKESSIPPQKSIRNCSEVNLRTMQPTMILALLCILVVSNAFTFLHSPRIVKRMTVLSMSDPPGPDAAVEAIRAKMAADPNYNPMADPQAMQVIDSLIPATMREFPNAIDRLKVAFQDATSGADAVADLNAAADTFSNKQELISSPQSKWIKGGMQSTDFSQSRLDDLYNKVRQEFPDVPEK